MVVNICMPPAAAARALLARLRRGGETLSEGRGAQFVLRKPSALAQMPRSICRLVLRADGGYIWGIRFFRERERERERERRIDACSRVS